VAALIDYIGFVGIDLGSLAVGGKLRNFPEGRCRTGASLLRCMSRSWPNSDEAAPLESG
jgi:hypothetical protein